MAWNDNLNGTARDIAACDNSPLRVLAGPGTGKSYAMKRRVARLLEQGADPERLLVVTFTRTAAADLVKEVGGLGVEGCDRVRAGTLHSFCFGILSRAGVLQATGRSPRPLLTFSTNGAMQFEAAPMIYDLGAFGDARTKAKRIRAFEAAWARLQHEKPGWPEDPVDAQFHRALLGWLRFHGAMLVGELVPRAFDYLRDNPADELHSQFDHVIVDEYQDLNKAEQVLLDILSAKGKLAIVGDPDQSIYSFRHANPEGIVDFHGEHPSTHDETLNECRRCPPNIVAIADALIRKNHPPQQPARLIPMPGRADGKVVLVQWASLADELRGIAAYVQALVAGGASPKDVLVLSPRKLVGYALRDAIVDAGVAAHSFYNEEALEEPAAQEAFALLCLLVAPEDRVAYRFWIGFGGTQWRAKQYAKILEIAQKEEGLSPREVMAQIARKERAEVRGIREISMRHAALEARLAEIHGLEMEELVAALFPASEPWATPLLQVWEAVRTEVDTPKELFEAFRGHISTPEVPEGDFARVMSLHKSKGLTAKHVVVTSCIEQVIPRVDQGKSHEEQERSIAEQRRLFYVALTRATDSLVVSSCLGIPAQLARRFSLPRNRAVASRFLNELGNEAPQPLHGNQWRAGGFL